MCGLEHGIGIDADDHVQEVQPLSLSQERARA